VDKQINQCCYSKWRHVYDWATQIWHALLDPIHGTRHYVPCCPADWSIFTSQDLFALQFLWNPSISFDCCIISHIHAYRSNLPQLLQLNSSSPNILGLPLTTQLWMRRIQGSIRFHHLQQRN